MSASLQKKNQPESPYFKERDQLKYPTRRDEAIEAGKTYRVRSGLRAQIYNITKTEIHGAIHDGGVWEMRSWFLNGKAKEGKGKDHPNDIVLAKPLEIEAGAMYKSRSGHPIKVFEINRDSLEFPVIGAIRDDSNHWLPRVWNLEGITKVPFGPNNDIMGEWSEG